MEQVIQCCHGTHKGSGFVVDILHLHACIRRTSPRTVYPQVARGCVCTCVNICVSTYMSQHTSTCMYVLQVNEAESDNMDTNMTLVVKNHIVVQLESRCLMLAENTVQVIQDQKGEYEFTTHDNAHGIGPIWFVCLCECTPYVRSASFRARSKEREREREV